MHVLDDPRDFAHDACNGFLAAYSRYVQRVPDTWAVMRRGGPRVGKVSVVVGGGSGHYPAFCGVVGTGMADAAVMGEVFTSPSAEQAYRTARALNGGAGVLFSFGNYAGDVLNFGAAQTRLRAEGVDCRTVLVTDDIASAPTEQAHQRRGVAGDFTVFKIAGAAAERGDDLNEVERLARHCDARTFSFGAAFNGCTLPGADSPLFTVPAGSMELGLGIHGEPGIRTVDSVDARGLARLLVEPILAERPADATGRVAVLLNGLGGTKYEELFVLFQHVSRMFGEAELELVLPEVGELVTSLDMAGTSLTVTWLDDELEEMWTAPADTPGFRRGQMLSERNLPTLPIPAESAESAESNVLGHGTADVSRTAGFSDEHGPDRTPNPPSGPEPPDSTASVASADLVKRALVAMLASVEANESLLGHLDAAAGDGDHGTAMVRGLRAASEASSPVPAGAQATLDAAADALADRGAGTSGMLWGVVLHAIGAGLGNGPPPTSAQLVASVGRAAAELMRVGGARRGDKTILDALLPFHEVLSGEVTTGAPIAQAWLAAAQRATEAAAQTAPLVARVGRARPLGAKGVGTPDPGATSMALCLQAVGTVLASEPSARVAR